MSEAHDEITLRLGESGEFLMTRHNSSLFTFAGHLATRNHIFLVTGEETEEVIQGTYIFAHADAYVPIASFMVQHAFPMHLNRNDVAECDEQAFQRSLDQLSGTMDDFTIPEDWK